MGAAASAVIDIDVEGRKASGDILRIQEALDSLASNAKAAFAGVSAFVAVDALRDRAAEMLEVFGEAERMNARLNATLKQTGNTTGFTEAQLSGMRDSFRDTLGVVEKDMQEVQNIFARTRVIGSDVFTGAQQTALDMAAAFGIELPDAAEELSEAMQDPANELEKFRRFGIVFTDAQKAMLNQLQSTGRGMEAQRWVLNELNAVVGGSAAAAADTLGGSQARIAAKFNELYVIGGELISNVLKPMEPALISLMDTMVQWVPVIAEVGTGIANAAVALTGWIEPLLKSSEAATSWAATLKTVFSQWKTYLAAVLLNAGADVVAFGDAIAHHFTVRLPAVAKILWTVFKDVFSQLGDMLSVVMTNMTKNIANFWDAIESVLSGGDFELSLVAPLEGFELKLSELPEIAERQMSETERVMREAATDLNAELAKAIDADIAKRVEKSKVEADKRAVADTGKKDQALTLGQSGPGGLGGGGGGTQSEGLLELQKRIAEAAAQQKMVSAIDAVANQQSQANSLLTSIRDKDPSVNVNVQQDDVVSAIREQTAALTRAYEASGVFA